MPITFRASLLTSLVLLIASSAPGQTPAPANEKPSAPGLIKLAGEDEKRAKQLDEQIDKALKADRWNEAMAKAEELLVLRTRAQGPKHFETVSAEWRLKALHRVAPMTKDDRAAYQSARTMKEQADALNAQGKYAAAQPLFEKTLEIHRRLLTDDHPETATSYNDVAFILNARAKYGAAQPLFVKALELRRRLLTDDHPDTAASYNNVAFNLNAQGQYAAAQPLLEKALEIWRRLLTDLHPLTARSYNNVAANLNAQGNYAAAQPLFERALAIHRQLLTDDHPDTAASYNNLAFNLKAQGKYATAQPLLEKTLEIFRRLLTDEHPNSALAYSNLASNLHGQGKYAVAQPLFEKALEIRRRWLTDEHPLTAFSYSDLATNLNVQGKYAAAQPLFEKALEIRRRLLTDDHPDTAVGYNNLAVNLNAQGRYAPAQPLLEKALEIWRRLLTDNHPDTARGYNNLAGNLDFQGKYAAAQPLFEKALEIRRRLLTDDHSVTAATYNSLAANLHAQGKYLEARDRWISAVRSLDAARLLVAFTGLERAGSENPARPALAAVLARLDQPVQAWQDLEHDLGRGLLDELAARQDRRLEPGDRARLRELTTELERLERLVETTPKGLDQAERAKRFEELKRQRALASIALGEFHTKLVHDHGPLAGEVAPLQEIQAALPVDAALVAWVDLAPEGPSAADPDGEHWGVVVRSRGVPAWITMAGTGQNGLWTKDDTELAGRVRTELRNRPGVGLADLRPLIERLRTQRLAPLAKALGATSDGLPPARRLIVLPSRVMAGNPIEALLAPDDTQTVSYAPSGTVFKYLREQPRPDRHAGLLALGDPVYAHPDNLRAPNLAPEFGLMLNVVARDSNAANHGLKDGDVLVAYNGQPLKKKDDLKLVAEGDKPIPIEVWRDGVSSRQELAPGDLGVVFNARSPREAITEQRKLQQVLAAARSGGEEFSALPGTRREVEAIAQLFRADDRPTHSLLGTEASEPELDRIAASGELGRFGFIHLATHGVIDEAIPTHSAVILTQTGLPDALEQALSHKPVFDGRLSVREIQRAWDLKAELVTLSACETALGKESGGEGFVGFTQALLMSGARSVCVSLWKVDDKATSLLMTRFYQNMLGKRAGFAKAMPKAEALREARQWLRTLTVNQVDGKLAALERGDVRPLAREKGAPARKEAPTSKSTSIKPYEHPHFWAAFVLVGDPD
jgi:tetratricopeptide (TPR) repeat protein